MSDVVAAKTATARALRRQRSIYQVHYAIPRSTEHMARPWPPHQVTAYESQVAGHREEKNDRYLGLLQCNDGTILKPILKEAQMRETAFYTRLADTQDQDLLELKKLVPKYFGSRRYTHNGHENEYIILEDLTDRMLEPCIMDVKIGKRTWDPLASEQKIKSEQSKYQACRMHYGFCIPGYQVHRLSGGKLLKYGKEHGKKMQPHMVKEAIRNFLNAAGGGGTAAGAPSPCRALLLQLLADLWLIQRWSARPRRLKIYSASLLLAYDARRLRDCCQDSDTEFGRSKCVPAANVRRRRSLHSRGAPPGASFSGQLADKGPVYKKVNSVPLTPISLAQESFSPPKQTVSSPWSEALDKMNRLHSFENNYEENLSKMKLDYRALLDQLANDDVSNSLWASVKVIDFAHAFFNDEEEVETVDENFKEGIDNFVAIFEELLKETDDQVF